MPCARQVDARLSVRQSESNLFIGDPRLSARKANPAIRGISGYHRHYNRYRSNFRYQSPNP